MAAIQISGAVLAARTNAIIPALNVWSRLEPLPLSSDLGVSLQAAIADPCWLLARQYQFAEFQGEDAGTPIDVRVEGEIANLSRYLSGPIDANAAKRASDYSSSDVPLEVQVEREPSRSTHVRFAIDAGAHWLRMLRSAGLTNAAQAFRSAYPVTLAAPRDPDFDDAGAAWRAMAALGAVDGRTLAADLVPLRQVDGTLSGLPTRVPVAQTDVDKVKPLAATWLGWFSSSLSESLTGSSWNPARQEYAAAASAEFSTGEVVLSADEYADGRLEWYDFHIQSGATLGTPTTTVAPSPVTLSPVLPTPVGYPGKPADRYWEFEDANVSFGGIDGGAVNIARMLLVEYALVFGNDWFVVPVDMPVGSLFRTTKFRVRDTFGVESVIAPSKSVDGPSWTMWQLSSPAATLSSASAAPSFFFLPPVLAQTLESDPVEEVALFRDEMANMAWGVERRVQGATGETVDRTREPLRAAANQGASGNVPDASILYRLATPVFERWIPFVPVAMAGSSAAALAMQLERRAMLRTLPDGTRVTVQPQGVLLRSDLSLTVDHDALRLEEEEVPREGVVVERTFQYARWLDGRSFVWLGRRKSVGKGEGASGLRFDRIDRL